MENRPGREGTRGGETRGLWALLTLALLLVTAPSAAGNTIHIAVVYPSEVDAYRDARTGFAISLADQGFSIEATEYCLKAGSAEQVWSRINQAAPDLVLSLGGSASRGAASALAGIPLVFCMVLNPDAIRTDNATGVSMQIPSAERLRRLHAILPLDNLTLGTIFTAQQAETFGEVAQACEELGVELIGRTIESERELPETLRELCSEIDCFMMIPDSRIYSAISVKHLLLQCLREGLPVVGLSSSYTRAGALIAFDCDYADLGRQAGELAGQVLRGAHPAEIEKVHPRAIRMSLNLQVAKRMGIVISREIRAQTAEAFGE